MKQEKGKLVYIPIEQLSPHPANPRNDLGDLTELADSIKANGVMQNLTVVPWETTAIDAPHRYDVIIGHRRLAAATMAGLTELPCVVVEMTPQEQISTMLIENMQRADLTVYEQAQGFQMMLDMGDSIEEIAEKSGFSQSTVRRRVKLLELDHDKFKASEARGATMQDYIELEKIEDPILKNKVLDAIGTPNFQNKLKSAIEDEQTNKMIAAWVEVLQTFAERIETYDYKTMVQAQYLTKWSGQNKTFTVPDDADEVNYYYTVTPGYSVTLYKEKAITTEDEEATRRKEEKRQLLEQKKEKLQEITERHYELRSEFVANFKGIKKYADAIMHYTADTLIRVLKDRWAFTLDTEMLAEILDIGMVENDLNSFEFAVSFGTQPEYSLLATVYATTDKTSLSYWETRWTPDVPVIAHVDNTRLTRLYDFLQTIGYEMSDEEKQMQDGTHPLFKDEEE